MVLTETGLAKVFQRIKSFIASQLNSKASAIHTHTYSEIVDLPNGIAVDSTLDGTSSNAVSNSAVADALDGKSDVGHTHTVSDVTDFPTLSTVATSGSYNDLSNKPTTMTPTSHTHGNITNDGKIGSNANKPLITTTNGVITTGSFGTTANTFCQGNDSRLSDARTPTSHTHTKSEITDFPTIPTVNNATLKIQKNGTDVKTFTANASSDVTCNITVPTKVSELTNDSGFLTSHQSLSNYSTLANTVKSISISGKTITVTPGSGNAYTLTTQDTVYTHPTTAGNKHVPSGGSSGQFLGWDSAGTAKWVNNPNSDTKNTAGSTDTSSKIFLIGATSQAANPQTYSQDTAYVGTDGCLYSGGTKVLTAHQSLSNYSTLANTIKSLSISGKTITYTKGDNTTGTLTTQDNNTWTAMVGATSSSNGSVGYVNAVPPKDGYNTKYLRADGTWQVPPDHTYTVNNATLTIQKNGATVKTFTANASSNVTCNITVPTNTNQLTNGSGFITSAIKESSINTDLGGWCLLYGDLLIQWGTVADTTNEYTVNFHKPYSNIPIVVANYGDNVSFDTPCAVDDIFKTAFEVKHSNSGAWRVNWIAIGKGA